MEIALVPIIISIIYMLMSVYKQSIAKGRESYLKLIPLIALICGGGLGVVFFYFVPSMMPTNNVVLAIIIGCSSGLAATGTNQIIKQMSANVTNNKTPPTDPTQDNPDNNIK